MVEFYLYVAHYERFMISERFPCRVQAVGPLPILNLWCCLPFLRVLFKVIMCKLLFRRLVYIVVFVLCVLLSSNVFMCTCCATCVLLFFTLDAGLLVRSQYSEGPVTGHLDTGFSWSL